MPSRTMRAHALTTAVLAGALLLAWPAQGSAATRIGPDLTASGPPIEGCGAIACAATQLAPSAGAASPVDGTIVRVRLRHAGASALGEGVRLLVLGGSETEPTIVRESATLTVTGPADQIATFPVQLPIAAGQRIGVQVTSTFAQPTSWLKVAAAAPGATLGWRTAGTSAPLVAAADRTLLLNADVEPAGGTGGSGGTGSGGTGGGQGGTRSDGTGSGGTGGGQGGTGSGGTGAGGTGRGTGTAVCAPRGTAAATAAVRGLPAPAASALDRLMPVASAAAWRTHRLDASDSYNEVAAAFDRRGRLHVAARGGLRHRLIYAGPGGRRLIEATNDQGSLGLATPRSGPAIVYGMDHAESVGGRLVLCDVLKLARGPAFRPEPVRAQPADDTGFFFTDLAADPGGDALHAIYELGRTSPRLFHWEIGGRATRLPLTGGTLRQARIAARGRTVAVAARTDRAFQLLVRSGGGTWRRTVLARRAGTFAVAVGRDGRARVAFVDDIGRLRLFTGRRTVATGAPVASVGLAVDDAGRLHVALTPTARSCHTTNVWDCRRGGIYHLRTDPQARSATVSTVQATTGDAPGRLAVAVHGAKVAIAYGNPGRSRELTVKRRG